MYLQEIVTGGAVGYKNHAGDFHVYFLQLLHNDTQRNKDHIISIRAICLLIAMHTGRPTLNLHTCEE